MKKYIVLGMGHRGLEVRFLCNFAEIPTCIEKAKQIDGIINIMVWRDSEFEDAQTYAFDGKDWILGFF